MRDVAAAARAAMRMGVAMAGRSMSAFERASLELGRRTHSVVTPDELERWTGRPAHVLSMVTYLFHEGGKVEPPSRVVVYCEPERCEGVMRSMTKLLESRGWTAGIEVGRVAEGDARWQ